MKLAVVSGYPPEDKQGEANYSSLVFPRLSQLYGDCQVRVFAHKLSTATHKAESESPPTSNSVVRVTNGNTQIARLSGILSLIRELYRFRPDVIHYQGTHTGLYGMLFGEPMCLVYLLMRVRGSKQVITMHSTWFKKDVYALCKQKHLGSFSTWLFVRYYGAYLWFTQTLVNSFRVCTAGTSGSEVKKFIDEWKLNSKKFVSEPHACGPRIIRATEQASAKSRLGLSGERIILTIGFIRPDKGIHLILDCIDEVLGRFPDAILIIAGEPSGVEGIEYANLLAEQISKLKHKNRIISKFEFIDNPTFETYFDAADVVVIPYLRVIGPSGPVHHAMSRGKAIVASNIGHNQGLSNEIVLFDPALENSLRQALMQMLESHETVEQWGAKSALFATNHSWENLARSYYSEYKLLMKGV